MIELIRFKRLLALAGTLLAIGVVGVVLVGAAFVVVRARTGADPADAFTPTEVVPQSLRGVVTWLDDETDLDRLMEPPTRLDLEGAWLRAAAARELDSDVSEQIVGHELRVDFYSLDGQIVGISGHSQVRREVGSTTALLRETHESVLVLTDGRWEIDRRVITGAILTNP